MNEPFIEDAGIYEMDAATYHADPVVGGSMSSTGARALVRATPAHYAYQREHGQADTRAFDFGRAAHTRVLGIGDQVTVIAGTGANPNAWTTKADKAAVEEVRAAGQTPITPRDDAAIDAMVAAVQAHPTAGPLLARPGRRESVWIWQDQHTGVWRRVMADFMPDVEDGARRLIVDYKTAKDASPDGFAKSMASYGYDQQADWYTAGVQALDPREDWPHFVFVAQEKEPPYLVTVSYPSPRALLRGRVLNERALATYRRCVETGQWPGYPTEPVELQLPYWAERELDDLTTVDLIGDVA